MTASMPNPLLELRKLGQSAWLDDISRGMLDDGSLARLIRDDGIAGLTSNPSIFANAIMKDPKYAQPIAQLLPKVTSAMALYEELALDDLKDAAALLRPLYDSSSGGDGFVSMEVSPHLADDSAGSLAEARRLWERLAAAERLHQDPGHRGRRAGDPRPHRRGHQRQRDAAVRTGALPHRGPGVHGGPGAPRGRRPAARRASPRWRASSSAASTPPSTSSSMRSPARGQPAARTLRGKAAIASACRAYEIYEELAAGERWQALVARGARPQRLLWASTSTKDPSYSPVKYVEELVVPETVNTMPLETLNIYRQPRPAGAASRAPHRRGERRARGSGAAGRRPGRRGAATRARGRGEVHRAFRQAPTMAREPAPGPTSILNPPVPFYRGRRSGYQRGTGATAQTPG